MLKYTFCVLNSFTGCCQEWDIWKEDSDERSFVNLFYTYVCLYEILV